MFWAQPSQLRRNGSTISTGEQSSRPDRVIWDSTRNGRETSRRSQTKLLFNESIHASARNRATRVGPPSAIVIERLRPLSREQDNADSARSSFSFSALSEERLQAAVKLAKRDVRRRRLMLANVSPERPFQEFLGTDTSDVPQPQEEEPNQSTTGVTTSSPKERATRPGAKQLQHKSRKNPMSPGPHFSNSPPTRDAPRPAGAADQQALLCQAINKLHNELETYIQRVQKLSDQGDEVDELLDPDEQKKLEVRRQKQAARSSCTIYVLQQQVRDIQEDIVKLRRQRMWDAKKFTVIARLTAAHQGTTRAMQVIIHQLSDLSEGKLLAHHKDLAQLIRQLSLCSASLAAVEGSAVPETAVSILEKLELLDSALREQELWQISQARTSSPRRKASQLGMSPIRAPRGARGPRKPPNPKRGINGRKGPVQNPRRLYVHPQRRADVLRAGVERLAQQRELRERQERPRTKPAHRQAGAPHYERKKPETRVHQTPDAGFRQPTVSSRLRENYMLPPKDHCVPWIPTSPHSPPPQRSPQRGRPEPRCLFSPARTLQSSPKQRTTVGFSDDPAWSSDRTKQAQDEALREAWLERRTMQRLRELDELSREEAERIQRLRSDAISPTRWAEQAEQKAREKIQPLLDEAQIGESRNSIGLPLRNRLSEAAAAAERGAESAQQLSAALLADEEWVEEMARRGMHAPTLESMLLRMEEIQRDEEEVRRRFASITYSDPLSWEQPAPEGPLSHVSGSRPASPQPIRITKPTQRQTPTADIVLKNPVETGVDSILSETSLTEEACPEEPGTSGAFPGPTEHCPGTAISVPGRMLGSIRRYHADYEAYLRAVAHEGVGSFDPWAIADSLAEELLSEALAEVAAEFQDVTEEVAEAVFTSEFLQPVQSPPTAALALLGL